MGDENGVVNHHNQTGKCHRHCRQTDTWKVSVVNKRVALTFCLLAQDTIKIRECNCRNRLTPFDSLTVSSLTMALPENYLPANQCVPNLKVNDVIFGFDCLSSILNQVNNLQVKQCQVTWWCDLDSWEILLCLWCAAVHTDVYYGSTHVLNCYYYYFVWIFFGDFNIMWDIIFWSYLGLSEVVFLEWIYLIGLFSKMWLCR